ncbi:RimK family alpha-L-glutamate ligase [Candidatus Thorarchaeota archaeon]|nr:MAG: RimK family alpha-L-glutamate ligase [Candidatus Thorarchaeota archaeon]
MKIGLFSSDPWSRRMNRLKELIEDRGESAIRVIPWKVSREGATDRHRIMLGNNNLSKLDALLVLDLGANDIGAFFNRVGLLSALTEMGVEVINSVASILLMRNKSESMRKLISGGLPVPRTLITESIETAAEFVLENHPCVLKPITGFGGLGVQLISEQFDIENVYDYLKFHSQMFGKGAYILQELIEGPGFDIRAFVLDGEVVATMQRYSDDGFVTNIHSGGRARNNDINVSDLAIAAAKSVSGRIVGVDIIPDNNGELWILEVNATPGWNALQRISDVDIADLIADSLINAEF